MLIWLICHILLTPPTIYSVAILKLFVQFGIKHQISPQNCQSYPGLWYPDSFSQKFIVPTDVGDVYLVGIPEEDPKYENSNMNIVPQSPPVEILDFLSSGPTAAGGASLMSPPPLMLTTP